MKCPKCDGVLELYLVEEETLVGILQNNENEVDLWLTDGQTVVKEIRCSDCGFCSKDVEVIDGRFVDGHRVVKISVGSNIGR